MKPRGIVVVASLVGLGAFATAIDAQVSPGPQSLPAGPTVTLTPEEQQQLLDLAGEASGKLRQVAETPPEQRIHDLLDEVLTGKQLPMENQQAFVDLFEPDRSMLHQEADAGRKILERVMQGGVPGGPAPVKLARISAPPPSIAGGLPTSVSRAGWMGYLRAVSGRGIRRSSSEGLFRRIQASSGTATEGGLNISWTDSDDVVTTQASGDLGGGATIRLSDELWRDTSRWVADNETGVGLGISKAKGAAGELGTSGTSATFDLSVQEHARVQRCPSADGLVTGKGKFAFATSASGASSAGSGQGSSEFREEFTAEGHVQEDAIVNDVKVDIDLFVAKRSFQKGRDGRVVSDSVNLRLGGTVTFDPHASDNGPEMQITRINTTQGLANAYALSILAPTLHLPAIIQALRKAYLKAEKEWNFEDKDNTSKCVTVTFTPKSKTKRGKPNQAVAVQAELVAINGQQPTAGTFDELEPVKGGDIQQSGARAAPRAPAALTYTAPQQAWSPSDPPGFDVVKAKSRAGAFMREHASEDEYRWLLQPGLKLVIHNKWEAQTPLGFLLSEATFPIELAADANGNLSGQAVVARTRRQREALAGFACQETGEWTETWRAQAAFDDTGEMLTIKITYQSSPKQVRVVCPKVAPKEYTQPGVARQTATPLDNFTMPADEGATKQFVFSAAGTTTNLIDVTVARAEDGGH